MQISNEAGETVFTGRSDAECARWWKENGRRGDTLDTGEEMAHVAAVVIDATVRGYDRHGCPVFYAHSDL